MIGKECIEKRLKAIDNEEETPNDVLTQILKASCKNVYNSKSLSPQKTLCDSFPLNQKSLAIERCPVDTETIVERFNCSPTKVREKFWSCLRDRYWEMDGHYQGQSYSIHSSNLLKTRVYK